MPRAAETRLRSYETIAPLQRKVAIKVFLVLAASPGVVMAQWAPNGTLVAPSATPQVEHVSVPDGSGGVFIAFTEQLPTGGGRIRAQHLLANGRVAPGWPREGIRVSTVERPQEAPAIVPDGAGGVFVAWLDSRSASLQLYGQRLSGNGARPPPWPAGGLLVSTRSSLQVVLGSATDEAGGIILARWVRVAEKDSIEILRLNGDGVVQPGWPVIVPGAGFSVLATPDGTGGAVVAWQKPIEDLVIALRIQGSGQVAAGWPAAGRPVATQAGRQSFYDLASDGGGGAYCAFMSAGTTYIQRLAGDGTVVPGWTDYGRVIKPGAGDAQTPVLCPDGTGGVFVAWTLNINVFTDIDVHVSRLTGAGSDAPGWPTDGVTVCNLPGLQYQASIAPDGQGGVIVAWQDQRDYSQNREDLYVQRITAAGATTIGWPANGIGICKVGGEQIVSHVVPDKSHGAIVSWLDARGVNLQVRAGRIGADGDVPTYPPDPEELSLTFVGNPSPSPVARANVPTLEPARLDVFDIRGRRVRSLDMHPAQIGPMTIEVPQGGTLEAGVYVVRLRQGGRQAFGRTIVYR